MTFFQNGTKETGNLLFFKYRTDNASNFQVFTSSSYSTPNGNHQFHSTLELDGEWHIAIIQAKNITLDADGNYIAKHLRFDVEGTAGAWAEFAYVGYAEKLADIIAYVNEKDSAENIKAYCTCPGFVQESTDGGLVECPICGERDALELPYVGPKYEFHFDSIAGTGISGSNGYRVVSGGGVADPYKVNVSFSGWIVAEYGCKEYAYRIVVDGVPGEWVYFAGSGTYDSGVANAKKSSYPNWDWDNQTSGPAVNCRFWNEIMLDLATLHGKTVNIEIVAVNNLGAYMTMAIISDILPVHGGRGGYEYIDDETHGVKCVGCGEIWTVEKHTDAPQGEAEYVDKNTHKVVCACEGVEFVSAHVGATVGVWSEALGYYESDVPCTSCGEKYDTVYKNWIDYSTYADGKTFGATGGGTSHSVTGGVLVMTPNGNTAWGGVSVGQVPASVGRYYVLKYRVTELAEAADTVKITIRFNDKNKTVTVDATEGWHTIVIDLATYCTDEGNGMVSTLKGADPDHWFINNADANMISYEVAFEGFADRLEGIPDAVCNCPEFAHVPAGEDTCAIVCSICGATIESFAAHDNTVLDYVQPDCINDGHTDGTECKNCGYQTHTVIPSTGAHAGGSDNEYCKGCNTFLKADPSGYFDVVLGAGNTMKWNNGDPHKSSWDINSGYMTYTKVTKDDPNGTITKNDFTGETGQYLFIKYKATGDAYIQLYVSTGSTKVNGAHVANIKDVAYGEWHYAIIDLSKAIAASGVKAADGTVEGTEVGKYYIGYFRLDVEGSAGSTLQIAYLGLDNSVDNIVAGIKAIEGVTNVKTAYCPCGDILAGDMVYQDTQYHAQTCKLCGTVTTMAHTHANAATWNADNSRYETTCTICNGLVVNPFQTTVNADFAGWKAAVNGGWHKYDSTTNGVRQFGPNSASGYGVSIQNPGTAGRYYILKYRVPAEAIQDGASVETATSVNIQIRFNGTAKTVTLKADDQWHVMLIDVATDWNLTVTNGRVTYTDYWFLMSSMYNSYKYFEVEYFGWTEFLDRLPTDLVSGDVVCDCSVGANVPAGDDVCQIVCAVCGTTVKSFAAHDNTVINYLQPDCINDGHTAGTECKNCGYENFEVIPSTGVCAGGSDGEYCKGCHEFIKADPEDYFAYFWGGENVPNGSPSAYVGTAEDTGYNVYNVKQGDHRNQNLISNANPTASTRYLVIKYKTDVAFQLGLFASTKQTGINGNYYLNTTLTAGGWKYVIVDLTTTASSGVADNGDGKYLLQHLTVDYDWQNSTAATAQIAYIALADTAADVINGIKAIDGVESIPESRCGSHLLSTLAVYELVGDGQGTEHYADCAVCGHKMTRGLSLGNFWGASYHWFSNPNGITNVVNNDDRIDGNLSCTSGIKEVKYVITNTGNAEETATVTTTPTYYSGVGGNASLNPEAFGDWEARKNTMHALVVPNWADVDGVDFSGDTVSITVYVVPNGDPTYSKAVVTFTITIAEDPAGAVES